MERGNPFDAQEAFARAVEIDPGLLMAHAKLAWLSWRIDKDVDAAESHIKEIVDRVDALDAPVAVEVAEYYRKSARPEFARQWYQEAIRLDPNYWRARLSLSRMLLEIGESREALGILERSRKEGVQDVRLSAYLADAYRQRDQFDRAIDEIDKVIKKYPKNAEYIFIRGHIHFDRGNYDTARKDFNKAYELDTRFTRAYFFVGRTAFAEEDYDTALKIFRQVLNYEPKNGEYRFFLGRALEQEERYSQALDEYRRVTIADPDWSERHPEVYIRRARLLNRRGDRSAALKDVRRALEIEPDMPEAHIAMGELLFEGDNQEKAIEHFEQALATEPKYPNAQFKLGLAYLLTSNDSRESRRKAALHFQRAIRYGYEDPEVYKRLAYVYRDLGQRSQAIETFKVYLKEGDKLPLATRREILRQIDLLGG
jgi:tetratricopeptide (TPR) repeat protein